MNLKYTSLFLMLAFASASLAEAKELMLEKVSQVRNELETAGYGLLNLRGSYEWTRVRLDYGVENLLDKFYAHPLSGAYVGEGNVMGSGASWGIPVPGMGRTVFTGVTLTF